MLRWPTGQPSRPPSCSSPRRRLLRPPLQASPAFCNAMRLSRSRSSWIHSAQQPSGQDTDRTIFSARVDNRFFVSAGPTWKVSRMLQFNAELREEWLHSNVLVVNSTAMVATVGARIQY